MKAIQFLLVCSFFVLCAFQCSDEPYYPELEEVITSVRMPLKVSPAEKSFQLGDTIWLEGVVTSKVFHLASGDSVLYHRDGMMLNIHRLKQPEGNKDDNSEMAASMFSYCHQIGNIVRFDSLYNYYYMDEQKLARANLVHRMLLTELSENQSVYRLKVGLIPNEPGIYVISAQYADVFWFDVPDRHESLYSAYGDPDEYSFYHETWTQTFWGKMNETNYLFQVEKPQ